MYKLSHHVEQMVFPLLFPSGDPGYSLNVPNNAGSSRFTAVQYFGWRLRVLRDFNIFASAGRLSQQFILHGCITMEWNRLNYIKSHQNLFRRETLQGLIDHVQYSSANTSDFVRLGRAVVLPSSFVGSPRAMQQHFQDCMALSRDVRRPDLFVTFTANPQWPEITEYLSQLPTGFTASDIPHVVVRAFYCRFEEFVKEIAAGKVFGKVMGYTFSIEFQKRGLPHAHCLFILNPRDKLLTPSSIDRFICAEIPPKDNFPNLHQKVSKHMLHGPHSEATPCYDKTSGICTKKFPFAFREETDMSGDGFPLYRRRDNRSDMHFYNKRIGNLLIPIDNSMVVPYNAYLLLKYNCHINVEYCGSVMAYKYIFKYVNNESR
nr:uncharacterized protein LOC122273048 [Parasteatoda tepidariorum]